MGSGQVHRTLHRGFENWEVLQPTDPENALAESFHGLYKFELIYRHGPWRGLDDVEFAALGYVDWFNHRRLHGEITDGSRYITPAAFEADHYRRHVTTKEAVAQ